RCGPAPRRSTAARTPGRSGRGPGGARPGRAAAAHRRICCSLRDRATPGPPPARGFGAAGPPDPPAPGHPSAYDERWARLVTSAFTYEWIRQQVTTAVVSWEAVTGSGTTLRVPAIQLTRRATRS